MTTLRRFLHRTSGVAFLAIAPHIFDANVLSFYSFPNYVMSIIKSVHILSPEESFGHVMGAARSVLIRVIRPSKESLT